MTENEYFIGLVTKSLKTKDVDTLRKICKLMHYIDNPRNAWLLEQIDSIINNA